MKTRYLTLMTTMAITLAMVVISPVQAASQKNEFSLKGLGYNSCADFTAARAKRSEQYFQFLGWLEGYLSFYNRSTPDTINVAPWQSTELLAGFLDAYCQANPKTPYVVAVDMMIAELVPHRLRESSDVLEAVNGNHKVTVYREVLKTAQGILKEWGFYKGPADGAFNDATRAALTAFQKSAKLEQTGVPDQATLYYLILKKP